MLRDRTRQRSNSYLEAVHAPPPPGGGLNPNVDAVSTTSSVTPSMSSRSLAVSGLAPANHAGAALWDGSSPTISASPSIMITEGKSESDLFNAPARESSVSVSSPHSIVPTDVSGLAAAAAAADEGQELEQRTAGLAVKEVEEEDKEDVDVEEEGKEYPYHPLNKFAFDKGYLGHLTDTQAAALDTMKTRVAADSLDLSPWLCRPAETEEHFLLRFLRARQFNVNKAWEMMMTDITWRTEYGTLALREKTMAEVVQCDVSLIHHHLPIWQSGFDLQGRPVVYKRFGRCEISTLKQHTAIDNLVRFHVWCTERQLQLLGSQSAKLGHNIETMLFVIDAAGWTVRLATQDAFRYLKGIADMDSAHYPERLGGVVIVNAPWALDMAWRVVQVWLDARTKAKVHILRRGANEALRQLIDVSQIPADYGGDAPALPDPPTESL
eukprot:m.39946 g.39946  ORF g.39946 m.39946 type:complete len:438 (-) comp10231_c0_seq2:25-1338(-)